MMNIAFDLKSFIISAVIVFISFGATAAVMPRFIKLIVRLRLGQEVRDDGPQAHLKKQGTPTMGGAVFGASAVCASVIGMAASGKVEPETLKILFLTLGFGFIGAADDYLKIRKHNSDGLRPRQKIALQLVFATALALWVYFEKDLEGGVGRVLVPFTGNFETAAMIHMPLVIFVIFAVFVTLGTDNGVNFTDGLDGLNASVTSVVAALFIVVGLVNNKPGVSFAAAGILGGLLGFLIYNAFPARIFMGDTGSLALGGFVAASAVTSGMELYVPVFGIIYLTEVVSVIIQVTYFKKTHGKRFFRMSPIHHHFELLGNSETRIVAVFTIITILCSIISFIGVSYVR